jgi:hypothetical protein
VKAEQNKRRCKLSTMNGTGIEDYIAVNMMIVPLNAIML